jgi:hypothetical protein
MAGVLEGALAAGWFNPSARRKRLATRFRSMMPICSLLGALRTFARTWKFSSAVLLKICRVPDLISVGNEVQQYCRDEIDIVRIRAAGTVAGTAPALWA